MQLISSILADIRKSFFNILLPFTDSGYYVLRHKVDPEEDEKRYIELYETTVLLHVSATFLILPAMFRYFKYRKFTHANPGKKNPQLLRKVIVPAATSFALTTVALMYEYKEDFYTKTKQIQNRYQDLILELSNRKPVVAMDIVEVDSEQKEGK